MKVSVELCVIPIGSGTSISGYIAQCCRVLRDAGLEPEINPHGTSVEGEWQTVFDALRRCHETLHADGVSRVFTSLKVNTRTDKEQSAAEKVEAVRRKLDG